MEIALFINSVDFKCIALIIFKNRNYVPFLFELFCIYR